MSVELYHGDCLDVMATLPDASIDCVLTDPPYGTTACKWDSVIPFEPMWKELKRIAKPKAAICLFGSQPFTSALVMSNPKMFRYEWIWKKNTVVGFLNANRQPLRNHENVVVFYEKQSNFTPQKESREVSETSKKRYKYVLKRDTPKNHLYGGHNTIPIFDTSGDRMPTTVQAFQTEPIALGRVHPTQKPVELLRYLIRTYTNEGETVLDFTMGSGSTGVACELENRNFIGIEKDEGYFEIAKKRIADVKAKEPLFMAA